MVNYEIRYNMYCLICDIVFYPSRSHAKTCCARCRSILHDLKMGLKKYQSQFDFGLTQLSEGEIKNQVNLIEHGKMCDSLGNRVEFLLGYKDSGGDIKRLIFRNKTLKHLEVWNVYEDQISTEYFRFGK